MATNLSCVRRAAVGALLLLPATAASASAQQSAAVRLGVTLTSSHRVLPDIVCMRASGCENALTNAGVPNELVTIPGGRHGGPGAEQGARACAAIEAFLTKHGVFR